jgi:hypothetical protein
LRRSLLVVVVLVSSIAATSIAAHASGSSAASAWKRCGKIKADPKGHFKVSKKGSVSCRSARKLMRQFLVQHKGTKHGGPYGYNTYWTLGRWKCRAGAGGGGCTRNHPKAGVQGVWTSR